MKILNWLKESNRLSHMYIGLSIWIVLMLLSIGIMSLFEEVVVGFTVPEGISIIFICTVLCDLAIFIAMCAVEYVQKSSGIGKWDWLDILAGILIPLIITFFIVIFILL